MKVLASILYADTAVQEARPVDVASLEREMLSLNQESCDVVHSFGPGIYVRQVTLKAGIFAVGHRQKQEHLNLMLTGKVTVIEDDGTHKDLVAPLMFTGQPGKKVGYVHEDCVWLNIYATDERDIGKLEEMFLDKSEAWADSQKLLSCERAEDRADFLAVLQEVGISEELVREQSENPDDQIQFPPGSYKVKVGRSNIEGSGLIATGSFGAGEFIAPARINGLRTPAGRYTNHSKTPNAEMRLMFGGNIALVSLRCISGCMGGNDGEEITVDYRQALAVNVESVGSEA